MIRCFALVRSPFRRLERARRPIRFLSLVAVGTAVLLGGLLVPWTHPDAESRLHWGALPVVLATKLRGALMFSNDGTSTDCSPSQSVKRVASVALAGDTLLLRLLGIDQLVAVSWVVDWPEYSPHAGRVPSRIPRLTDDPEAVIALVPDLAVVADHSAPGLGSVLRAAGTNTLELAAPLSLDAVIGDVERVGDCVGAVAAAQHWTALLRDRVRVVETHAARRRRWRALIVDSGFAQGLGTLADDLLLRLNAANPVRATGLQGGVALDAERLLDWQPQVVFVAVHRESVVPDARSELAQIAGHELLRDPRHWAPLRVVGIGRHQLGAVSPFALDALETMDRILEELGP